MADEAANPRVVRQRLRGVVKDALQKHLEVLQAAEALAKGEDAKSPKAPAKEKCKQCGRTNHATSGHDKWQAAYEDNDRKLARFVGPGPAIKKNSEMCKTAGCTGSLHKCAMRKDSLDTTASMPSSDLAMGEMAKARYPGYGDVTPEKVRGTLGELRARAAARQVGGDPMGRIDRAITLRGGGVQDPHSTGVVSAPTQHVGRPDQTRGEKLLAGRDPSGGRQIDSAGREIVRTNPGFPRRATSDAEWSARRVSRTLAEGRSVRPEDAKAALGRDAARISPDRLDRSEIAKAGIHDAKTVVSGKPRPTSAVANDWKPGTAVGSTSGSVSFPKRGLAAANLNAAPTRSWEKGEMAKAGPVVEEHDPEILEGIARGPYAAQWMDHQEEQGHSLSGVDGYEAAPPTPQEALQWAHGVANHIVAANGGKPLAQLHQEAQAAGYPHDAGHFGFHLGMQHVGHGVGYADDMPSGSRNLIQVGHGEEPYYNFEPHSEPLKSAESTEKAESPADTERRAVRAINAGPKRGYPAMGAPGPIFDEPHVQGVMRRVAVNTRPVKKTDIAAVAHGVGTVVPAVRAAATGMVAALRARAKLGGIGKAEIEIKTGTVDTAAAKGAVLPGDKKPEIVGGKADDAGSGGDVEKGKSPLKKADGDYESEQSCRKAGTHLKSVDSDGFCNNCGHGPSDADFEEKPKSEKGKSPPSGEKQKPGKLKKDAADVAFGIPGSMKPKMPRTTPGLPGMTAATRTAPAAKPMGRPEGLHAPASPDTLAADKKAAGVGLMASLITRFKGIGKRGWSAPSAHSSPAGAVRAIGRRMAMAEKPDAPAEFEVGAKIRQKSTGRTGTVRHVTGLPGARRHKIVPDDGGAPQTWESHDMEHAEPIKKAGTLPAGPAAAPKTVASIPKTPAAGPKGPRMKTTGGAGPA